MPASEAIQLMGTLTDATLDVLSALGMNQHDVRKQIAEVYRHRLPAGFPVEQLLPLHGASHGAS